MRRRIGGRIAWKTTLTRRQTRRLTRRLTRRPTRRPMRCQVSMHIPIHGSFLCGCAERVAACLCLPERVATCVCQLLIMYCLFASEMAQYTLGVKASVMNKEGQDEGQRFHTLQLVIVREIEVCFQVLPSSPPPSPPSPSPPSRWGYTLLLRDGWGGRGDESSDSPHETAAKTVESTD
jgi:hypothetical protein